MARGGGRSELRWASLTLEDDPRKVMRHLAYLRSFLEAERSHFVLAATLQGNSSPNFWCWCSNAGVIEASPSRPCFTDRLCVRLQYLRSTAVGTACSRHFPPRERVGRESPLKTWGSGQAHSVTYGPNLCRQWLEEMSCDLIWQFYFRAKAMGIMHGRREGRKVERGCVWWRLGRRSLELQILCTSPLHDFKPVFLWHQQAIRVDSPTCPHPGADQLLHLLSGHPYLLFKGGQGLARA